MKKKGYRNDIIILSHNIDGLHLNTLEIMINTNINILVKYYSIIDFGLQYHH